MRDAGRGTQRRDRIGNAGLRERHDVHITFDDEQLLDTAQRQARFVQSVQLLALVEHFGFRRIQIFRLLIAEHATAEADDATTQIADWKRDPIAESIVRAAPDHSSRATQPR